MREMAAVGGYCRSHWEGSGQVDSLATRLEGLTAMLNFTVLACSANPEIRENRLPEIYPLRPNKNRAYVCEKSSFR